MKLKDLYIYIFYILRKSTTTVYKRTSKPIWLYFLFRKTKNEKRKIIKTLRKGGSHKNNNKQKINHWQITIDLFRRVCRYNFHLGFIHSLVWDFTTASVGYLCFNCCCTLTVSFSATNCFPHFSITVADWRGPFNFTFIVNFFYQF